MEQKEIESVCNEMNVACEGAYLHNERWILSASGDMIGMPTGNHFYYLIENDRLTEENWCYHLWSSKANFDMALFLDAFVTALCRAGVDECVQKFGYNGKSPKITIHPQSLVGNSVAIKALANEMMKLCI